MFLIDQIQTNLQENELTKLPREKSEIADIVFSFNNREIISLLKKRYKYLCKAQFDKAEEIENKMTKIKDEKFDELVTPNNFWCTFKEGEGQQGALKLQKIDCDGHTIKIQAAQNPSNLMWSNHGVPKKEQYLRGSLVVFVILVIFCLVLFVYSAEL